MCAFVLYQLFQGSAPIFMTSLGQLIFGCLFLYILCAAGLDFVGWGILMFPIMFYIFLIVIIVFNKGFQIESKAECKEKKEDECEAEPTCEESKCA